MREPTRVRFHGSTVGIFTILLSLAVFVLVAWHATAQQIGTGGSSASARAGAAARLEMAIANEKARPGKAAAIEVDAALLEYNNEVAAGNAGLSPGSREIESSAGQSGGDLEVNGLAKGQGLTKTALLTSAEVPDAPEATRNEVEPNDTSGTATVITFTPTAIVTGAINPGGDVDFYAFTAPAGSRVWLETDTGGTQNGGATSRDSVVDLLAADGTTVIENDDDDGLGNGGDGTTETGLASLIAGRTLTAGGLYFIRVKAFSATGIINPYRLFVSRTNVAATPEVEANNTAATANVANSPALLSGSISVAGDADYYSVSANAGDTIFFPVDADPERDGTGTDLVVEFRSPADAILLSVDSSITGDLTDPAAEGANFTVQASGTYFIKVKHFSATGTGTYNIHIIKTGAITSPLLISEFRLRGPSGANDEFVEVYNNSGINTIVSSQVGSGFAIAASDGVARCTIPNGTVIPARGHFLCTNSVAYSLGGYATGDATFTTDIPDNAGIALFNNNVPANFVLANRLDAVGSNSEANPLYVEGTGYPALTPFSIDYSFYRDSCGQQGSITNLTPCPVSVPVDTGNNANDFVFVDTNGTSAGAGQRLGSPGPENLASPIQNNAAFANFALDSTVFSGDPPNTIRDPTQDPATNSTFGTVEIRRRFVNNTGADVTRLRFRVVKQTTFPAPTGTADLRTRTTGDTAETVNDPVTCSPQPVPCIVTVLGTTLEQPPSQPNGGAFNGTWSVNTVTPGTPIAPGNSVNVRFLVGVQQTGSYDLGLNIEVLPGGGNSTALPFFRGGNTTPFTAAGATVGGRVLSADGRGVTNATVTISDSSGATRTAITGRYGTYHFDGVETGRSYTVWVNSRRFRFTPVVFELTDNLSELNFIALGNSPGAR